MSAITLRKIISAMYNRKISRLEPASINPALLDDMHEEVVNNRAAAAIVLVVVGMGGGAMLAVPFGTVAGVGTAVAGLGLAAYNSLRLATSMILDPAADVTVLKRARKVQKHGTVYSGQIIS